MKQCREGTLHAITILAENQFYQGKITILYINKYLVDMIYNIASNT